MSQWIVLSLFLPFVFCSCPDGFDLVANGQCRGIVEKNIIMDWSKGYPTDAIDKCAEHQAIPIIIHNEEEQEYWKSKATPGAVQPLSIIGLVCNATSKKWEWLDGSPLDYKPQVYPPLLNGYCMSNQTWVIVDDGHWTYGGGLSYHTSVYCIHNLSPMELFDQCNEQMCYEMAKSPSSWADAENVCKELGANVASVHSDKENSFIRRLAVSRGFVDGIFLGATVSGKSDDFGWIDGSKWNYSNFEPGFPNSQFGQCVGMVTSDTSGRWTNLDCTMNLPFVCKRKPLPPSSNSTCIGGYVKEGDLVISPGFPTISNIPCMYFLSVEAGKQIELEIKILQANSCCDRLIIYEGTLGSNVIANLTGEIYGKTYRTAAANTMRVSWEPTDGRNVAGMMISYHAI